MAELQSGGVDRMTWWESIRACSGTAADRKNRQRFLYWLMAWAATYVGATWVLENVDGLGGVPTWILAVTPSLFLVAAIGAYLHFLRMTDELQRRIQVEGLAFGFGAAVVFALGYELLEFAGAPQVDSDTIVIVMMIAWPIGQLIGTWRYR